MSMTRRRFLATGAALTALSVAAPPLRAQDTGANRVIPSTGARIPVVGLGTWITFNVGNDPALLERSTAVMAAFFEDGGGMIDSSPMYGSSQGTVGHGLEALGRTGDVFSADKVWTASPGEAAGQIERSRTLWEVPHFRLLQVHNLVAWEAHLETLGAMKQNGRIDLVGVTTSHGRRHGELEEIMTHAPVDTVQLTYNALDRAAEDRLLPLARERGLAVIVNRPYRQGALTRRMASVPLPGYAAELGATSWAQLLLKFIISHPAVTVAIPATTRPEHMRQNKAAATGPMPDDALRRRIARDVADA